MPINGLSKPLASLFLAFLTFSTTNIHSHGHTLDLAIGGSATLISNSPLPDNTLSKLAVYWPHHFLSILLSITFFLPSLNSHSLATVTLNSFAQVYSFSLRLSLSLSLSLSIILTYKPQQSVNQFLSFSVPAPKQVNIPGEKSTKQSQSVSF